MPQLDSLEVPVENLLACLDLTALNDSDDAAVITHLCEQAILHKVAAVCVAPHFVTCAKQALVGQTCQLATVANFPRGTDSLSSVLTEIHTSLARGATEIDVVVPYQSFLMDKDAASITHFVKTCKALCGPDVHLKTILESGLIEDPDHLERLAVAALEGGADFLKTSTGKRPIGATLEAATVLLKAIKTFGDTRRGFKAAGGVKTYSQAQAYWLLAASVLGESWPKPSCFRLGASTLLNELLGQGFV